MGKHCFVPHCFSGYRNNSEKFISLFKAPKDKLLLEKWRKSIGRTDRLLSERDNVCEKHFAQGCVVKKWVARFKDGTVVQEALTRPKLCRGSIPTIFPESPPVSKRRCKQFGIPIDEPSSSDGMVKIKTQAEVESDTDPNCIYIVLDSKPNTSISELNVDSSEAESDICNSETEPDICNSETEPDIYNSDVKPNICSLEVNPSNCTSETEPNACGLEVQPKGSANIQIVKVWSDVNTFSFPDLVAVAPKLTLPSSTWGVHLQNNKFVTFSDVEVISLKCVVIRKSVTFDTNLKFNVLFNGKELKTLTFLKNKEGITETDVLTILKEVHKLRMCTGALNQADVSLPYKYTETGSVDGSGVWRHKNCQQVLVEDQECCVFCLLLRNKLIQSANKLKYIFSRRNS